MLDVLCPGCYHILVDWFGDMSGLDVSNLKPTKGSRAMEHSLLQRTATCRRGGLAVLLLTISGSLAFGQTPGRKPTFAEYVRDTVPTKGEIDVFLNETS